MKDIILKSSPKQVIVNTLKIISVLLIVDLVESTKGLSLRVNEIHWDIILILPFLYVVFTIVSYYFRKKVTEFVLSNGIIIFTFNKRGEKRNEVLKCMVKDCNVEMKCFFVDVTCFYLRMEFRDINTNQILATIVPLRDGFNKRELIYMLKMSGLISQKSST